MNNCVRFPLVVYQQFYLMMPDFKFINDYQPKKLPLIKKPSQFSGIQIPAGI